MVRSGPPDPLENPPSSEQLRSILDSISEGVFSVDTEWRITSFNRAAERITGIPREEALGRHCHQVLQADICGGDTCALRYTIETGSPVVNFGVHIKDGRGVRVPISISTTLLRDRTGRVIGGVETFRDLRMLEQLRKKLESSYTFHDIISKSPRIAQLLELLPTIARSDSTVLIEGESGTGKELLARAIHDLSERRRKPLVAVNCGAIPETLLESELFGYRAGAFTGATRDKPGKFALAHQGTIFLDEIGEIPATIQVKLLRVIQERAYEPLGGLGTVDLDARLLAATNHNLAEDVANGSFREDLYYRLNVIRVELPPLRKRMEDVPLLVEHFLIRFSASQGKEISSVSPEAMAALMSYDYPGNIRELENIIEHASVLCPGGQVGLEHLPPQHRNPCVSGGESLPEQVANHEAKLILEALEQNRWSRQAAARQLGIHKTTLFKKIKRYGIELPPGGGRSSE